MTFSFKPSRRDFVQANIAFSRRTYWFVFGFWILLAIFSVSINKPQVLHGSASQRVSVFVPVVICGLVFLLIMWLSPRYRARRIMFRETTWTFSDEGLHLESSVSKSDLRWEAFLKYRETSNCFLLFVQKGMAQFVPKRVLTTQQREELRRILAAHVKAS